VVLIGPPLDAEGVDVACPLVMVGPSCELRSPESAGLRFERISTEALTASVVFRLRAGRDESGFELCLTLEAPIVGPPAEREVSIARNIIKDRAAFMSYLRCQLADLGESLSAGDLSPSFGAPRVRRRSAGRFFFRASRGPVPTPLPFRKRSLHPATAR
jgi:hypothetical protein